VEERYGLTEVRRCENMTVANLLLSTSETGEPVGYTTVYPKYSGLTL
jgi:hypothetical protein